MKKLIILIISLLVIVATSIVLNKKDINDNYYMEFIGGSGEEIYTTYLYWDGKQDADYICTRSVTKSYGSPDWDETVIKKGHINFVQQIYEIAKNNSSFDFATINQDVQVDGDISYKKGDNLTIEQVYGLMQLVQSKIEEMK